MATKLNGHAKLKRSLVLRDFLLKQLDLRFNDAMNALNAQERECGVEEALTSGGFLAALFAASTSKHRTVLESLDHQVQEACREAAFTPRYPQYFSLLLMAHLCQRLAENAEAMLTDAQAHLESWRLVFKKQYRIDSDVADFTEEDLRQFAFWMATGAGKTHVMHACLVMLEKQKWAAFGGKGFDRVILVTPSETLSRQHAVELRRLNRNPVCVYPDDGDASQIAHLSEDTVIVIDINKLVDGKTGDGIAIDVSAFGDSRNLVFVDEGHRGQKTKDSVWKSIQQQMAGIVAMQPKYRGMLIEFSATFGQVAEAEHAFDRYAKSIVFDYAYDRFHGDRYGKDFHVTDLQALEDRYGMENALTASLVTYWYQLHAFNHPQAHKDAEGHHLNIEKPLWVLLGLSVVGSKKDDESEYRSDVVETLRYLADILSSGGRANWHDRIDNLMGDDGKHLLPNGAHTALTSLGSKDKAGDLILQEVFGYRPGAIFTLRLLRRSEGELALGLSHGDQVRYFGVVNVGDAEGLARAIEPYDLAVEADSLTNSLFADLERKQSSINLLIGSRRFSEGWNNYRASVLTLLRLGSGEGPLIIQMFGRVVRFRGSNEDGKRLESPTEWLRPLQTAYIYGLRADYLRRFLEQLNANGIQNDHSVPVVPVDDKTLGSLLHLAASNDPEKSSFNVCAVGSDPWYKKTAAFSYSLALGVQTTSLQNGQTQTAQSTLGDSVKAAFTKYLHLLDFDSIYFRLLSYRNSQGWWNLSFDREGLRAALEHGDYILEGSADALTPTDAGSLLRLENLAVALLQRMLRGTYNRQEARHVQYVAQPLVALAKAELIPDALYEREMR